MMTLYIGVTIFFICIVPQAPGRSWADHQWALCVLDDTIEYGGPACVKYQAYFLPAILSYIQDRSPDVRQAAVYGCGVLGQFGGDSFAGKFSDNP